MANLNPNRPIAILNAQKILDVAPPIVFCCPLSTRSYPEFDSLHIKIAAKDKLNTESYALIEHCRAINRSSIISARLALLEPRELREILKRLQLLVGIVC